jgi:hypothetical protein
VFLCGDGAHVIENKRIETRGEPRCMATCLMPSVHLLRTFVCASYYLAM